MIRVLDFQDGFQSSTEPNLVNLTSTNLKSFASDAEFVADKGSAAVIGDIYLRITDQDIRFFNGTEWTSTASVDNAGVIENEVNPILLAGSESVRRSKQVSKSDFIEELYEHDLLLSASQVNTVISELSFDSTIYACSEVTYYLKESTTNGVVLGTLRIVTDGTNVFLSDSNAGSNAEVFFSADLNTTTVQVKYSSGTNALTLRADIKRFLK